MHSTRKGCATPARCSRPPAGAWNCLRVAGARWAGELAMTTAVLEIDGVAAPRRLAPTSADELAEALGAADANGQAVAPVGGGTQLDLGMPPQRLDVVLETTRLDQVV